MTHSERCPFYESVQRNKIHHIVENKKHDNLWNQVLNDVNDNSVLSLIYQTVVKGKWGFTGGSFFSTLSYKGRIIKVTFNIVNGIFKLGSAWILRN